MAFWKDLFFDGRNLSAAPRMYDFSHVNHGIVTISTGGFAGISEASTVNYQLTINININ